MGVDKESIIKRIDKLTEKAAAPQINADGIFFGTVTLVELLYGKDSPQEKHLFEMKKSLESRKYALSYTEKFIIESTVGVLNSIKSEVEAGLILTIQKQVVGELYGSFIVMAKETFSNGYKDAAAVLASAAVEDALKKFAEMNELNVEDKDMSKVINALKSKSLLKGPQATIVQSYVKLRNKAFHAEWSEIDSADVKSLISFTEEFILKNFS